MLDAPAVADASPSDAAASLDAPDSQVDGGARRPGVHWLARAGAAYTAAAVALLWGAWRSPLSRNAGAGGDMPIFAWSLRWVPWALAHGTNPLFTRHLDAPTGANLMWNTTVMLPAALLTPITLLGGPVLSFNVLSTLGLVVPSLAAAAAFTRVTSRRLAAWVGGLAWGFGPWILGQTRGDHLHMSLGAAALPMLAIAAHEMLVVQRHNPRWLGLVIGVVSGAWILVGEEALVIAVLTVGVALVVLGVRARVWRRAELLARRGYATRVAAWAAAAFVVVAAVPVGWQLFGPQRIQGAIFSADQYSADLLAIVTPSEHQMLRTGGSAHMARTFASEDGAYLGVPVLAAVGVVAWRRRRDRRARAAVWIAGVLWLFSLGPHLRIGGHLTSVVLPWALLGSIPPLDNLLAVRLSMSVGFVVAGLLAVGVEDAVRHVGRVDTTLAGLAVLVCSVTLAPGLPFRSTRMRVPAFFTSSDVSRIPDGTLVEVVPEARPERSAVQLWQAEAGLRFRMSGGYMLVPDAHGHASFAVIPGPTAATAIQIEDGLRTSGPLDVRRVRADLSARRVSTVIVGPMAHQDDVLQLFRDALGAQPVFTNGVAVWQRVPELLAAEEFTTRS